MKKSVSLREMIMLGLLIVIVAYYFLVQVPVTRETGELETLQADIESDIDVTQTMLTTQKHMQSEIDKVFEKNANAPEMIPEYSNINNIILELNTILDDTENYNISFSAEETVEDIVRRGIQVQFTTKTYEAAIEKLQTVHDSKNQYLIQNISVTNRSQSNGGDAQFGVVLQLMSFEYIAK